MNATYWKTPGSAVLLLAVALGGDQPLVAQCGGCSSHASHGAVGHADHAGSSVDHAQHASGNHIGQPSTDVPQPARPVYGGQVTSGQYGSFEVVYLPLETRVYLLDTYGIPVSARGVQGQVTMQMRQDGRMFSFPLTYVANENGGSREDYLGALIDVTRVRNGDMTVTVELVNLPFAPTQRSARFVQTFALSRPPATVQVVALTEADRPAVERQQVCPVLGTRLGEMGTPVKLLVQGQPLYLCCQGCVAKLQDNPAKFVPPRGPDSTAPVADHQHAHH